MLLFKPKPKEILPPPPPSSEPQEAEIEEIEEPKFFDKVLKPEEMKEEAAPEEEEFGELFKELGEEAKPKKSLKKKAEAKPKHKLKAKQVKVKKQTLKITPKPSKKTTPAKKPKSMQQKSSKVEEPELELPLEEDFGLGDLGLPKELEEPEKELEMPETLEGIDFGKELEQEKQKPQEVIDAEEEIKSAIEKIKVQEKPSFLKRLFKRKEEKEEAAEKKAEEVLPEAQGTDGISRTQNSINKARDALAKFDLKEAKRNYIEAMSIYNSLNPEEQAKVYHDIRELYYERKSAEGLKV